MSARLIRDFNLFKKSEKMFRSALNEISESEPVSYSISWSYLFPQLAIVADNRTAKKYGLHSIQEAITYFDDDILRGRLIESAGTVLERLKADSRADPKIKLIERTSGADNATQLLNCMTLFACITEGKSSDDFAIFRELRDICETELGTDDFVTLSMFELHSELPAEVEPELPAEVEPELPAFEPAFVKPPPPRDTEDLDVTNDTDVLLRGSALVGHELQILVGTGIFKAATVQTHDPTGMKHLLQWDDQAMEWIDLTRVSFFCQKLDITCLPKSEQSSGVIIGETSNPVIAGDHPYTNRAWFRFKVPENCCKCPLPEEFIRSLEGCLPAGEDEVRIKFSNEIVIGTLRLWSVDCKVPLEPIKRITVSGTTFYRVDPDDRIFRKAEVKYYTKDSSTTAKLSPSDLIRYLELKKIGVNLSFEAAEDINGALVWTFSYPPDGDDDEMLEKLPRELRLRGMNFLKLDGADVNIKT